jgi:pantetheine-phosphate adenylyltransferase
MTKPKTKAVYAGSFDPFTRGHLDIVEQALKVFDQVIIAIGENPSKKRLFDIATAKMLIGRHFNGDINKRIVVTTFKGALVNFADSFGDALGNGRCTAIIRGLRQISDFNDEFRMHGVNSRAMPSIPMVYFICHSDYLHVASSTAREMGRIGHGYKLAGLSTCRGRIEVDPRWRIREGLASLEGTVRRAQHERGAMTDLFQTGHFVLASGATSGWKIECDGISPAEWDALALMASEMLPPFGSVEGVPRGGIPFADALRKYATQGPLLICEDVVTTGGSMERYRAGREANGVAVFARGTPPDWVVPIFTMTRKP